MRKRKKALPVEKVSIHTRHTEDIDSIATLERAWNNLPEDITYEEREIFLEIAERIVRYHSIVQNSFEDDITQIN